jgi:hypothetical protein
MLIVLEIFLKVSGLCCSRKTSGRNSEIIITIEWSIYRMFRWRSTKVRKRLETEILSFILVGKIRIVHFEQIHSFD